MNIDYSVAQALMHHSVGTVATAIEQHSCYHGRDRFGRLRLLKENEQEEIFKLLEGYYIQERIWYLENNSSEEDGEVPSDIFDCNFELPHWHFGWPKDDIPELLKNSCDSIIDSIGVDESIAEFKDKYSKRKSNLPSSEVRDEIYTKAKYTHLAIIGAFIRQCKLDINAKNVANEIALIVNQNTGWPISNKTITNILKQIPDAIERKRK